MYLNLASIDDLDHFRRSLGWPVAEAEKERLFEAIIDGCEDLMRGEPRHFHQQILRAVLPTVASGCMNACYSAIVLDRLQSAGTKPSNYRPSLVDYFSWHIRDGAAPVQWLVSSYLAPYLGWKGWLRHGVKRLGRHESDAVLITTNPTLEQFLKVHKVHVDRSHFVEWFWPLWIYSNRRMEISFSQGLYDRLWASVEPFRPGRRVRQWLSGMIQENVDLAAATLLSLFRSRRARETRVLYTATQGHPATRLASLAVLENGGSVSGLAHGGGLLTQWSIGWMIESLTTSAFYCYTPTEQRFRRRAVPPWVDGSAEIRVLPQDDKEHVAVEHRGKIRQVLFLSGSYAGDRTHVGVLPEPTRFDLELRIIDALIRYDVKVIVKLHRKSRSLSKVRSLLEARYGDRIIISDTPLAELLREGIAVDAFVMENVKGGSLIEVMKTDRPVILFSCGMHFLQPSLCEIFHRRVKVISCWYDDENRVLFEEDELREYLSRDSRILGYEVVDQCTNARFEY